MPSVGVRGPQKNRIRRHLSCGARETCWEGLALTVMEAEKSLSCHLQAEGPGRRVVPFQSEPQGLRSRSAQTDGHGWEEVTSQLGHREPATLPPPSCSIRASRVWMLPTHTSEGRSLCSAYPFKRQSLPGNAFTKTLGNNVLPGIQAASPQPRQAGTSNEPSQHPTAVSFLAGGRMLTTIPPLPGRGLWKTERGLSQCLSFF